MKKAKFPLPKKYWVYLILCVVFGILLFMNIFVTNGVTQGKEFLDFTPEDWFYFSMFLLREIMIGSLFCFFTVRAGRLSQEQQTLVNHHLDHFKYAGIEPGDYDYIWFDYNGDRRAKIVQSGDVYHLYVENFDSRAEVWNAVHTVSVFCSLEAIKKVLFYEFDFFCEENTVLDKYGDEMFRDES